MNSQRTTLENIFHLQWWGKRNNYSSLLFYHCAEHHGQRQLGGGKKYFCSRCPITIHHEWNRSRNSSRNWSSPLNSKQEAENTLETVPICWKLHHQWYILINKATPHHHSQTVSLTRIHVFKCRDMWKPFCCGISSYLCKDCCICLCCICLMM